MSLEPRDPAEIEQYIAHALDLVAEHGLYRDRVNWNEVRDLARRTAGTATRYADTHRLLYRVLKEAGGPHSYLKLPYQYPRPAASAADAADAAEASASVPAQASLAPRAKPEPALPDGELLDRVAVIRVPALSRDKGFARRYATEGNAAVRRLAAAAPRGWVVDLRDNTGGDMWPMLAAIGALLVPGVLGYFVEPDGRRQEWRYRRRFSVRHQRHVELDGRPMIRMPGPRRGRRQPLAVLTSDRTASAGEAVLVAVRSQRAVRSFGAPTAGLTSANKVFTLSDGTRLVITHAFYGDAAGQLVDGPVIPDQAADDAMAAARAWIEDWPPEKLDRLESAGR
jgi:carboxyl-terminal processing protease